ncbi:ribonuclease H-like domain-containing protein [Candidatus Uhrbacteria bacterium]|nr:ribonuclease H-like domain-containing protein [Candidatus Uhrbacteria bacterium]
MNMHTLIFDIETVGEDFDAMDATTQEVMTRWVRESARDEEEYGQELARLKGRLGFSPFTGTIVAIGTLDADSGKGGVYFQAPGKELAVFEEDGVKFEPMDERRMLEKFWEVAQYAQVLVGFNSRGFDAPFLVMRSAVHRIPPTVPLMAGRYLYQQRGVKHVDLMDQLQFYGSVWKRPNLHLVTRALGIESPKAEGVTGDDVAPLFQSGDYETIARYNLRDLHATRELYRVWQSCIHPATGE